MDRGGRNLERLRDLQFKIDDILSNMKDAVASLNDYRRESLMDLIEEIQEEYGDNSLETLKAHILKLDRHC